MGQQTRTSSRVLLAEQGHLPALASVSSRYPVHFNRRFGVFHTEMNARLTQFLRARICFRLDSARNGLKSKRSR